MSEPEERPYAGVQEEQNEEVIQEGAEAKVEQEAMGEEAIRSKEEEEQETVAKEKVSEQEEEEKVKVTQTQKKKMAPKSRPPLSPTPPPCPLELPLSEVPSASLPFPIATPTSSMLSFDSFPN